MANTVVIAHMYNEEFLLPFWLKHHLKLFDHGVMIDYASTDNSAEIVRELAPNWELRQSRNKDFSAEQCDLEVLDTEQEFFDYWKVALNLTEFVMTPNLKEYCQYFGETFPSLAGFRMHGVRMVDPTWLRDFGVNSREPLIKQRHYGYLDSHGPRCRIVHRAFNGGYWLGRHSTDLNVSDVINDVFCLWYGFSPFDLVRERKLQIQDRIPQEDKNKGLGIEHILTEVTLEEKYYDEAGKAYDLLEEPIFNKIWKETMDTLYGENND